MRLTVRLTPRAQADRLDGWSRDEAGRPVLNARVRAAPVEGEANAALEALLSKVFFRPRSAVRVMKGGSARLKQVEIDGLEDSAVDQLAGGVR
ncbi:MAG TPA: DUF167 family protein [Caulobacteraceae bacterium]|jgi:hypothetical protein